jgi:hypothetical protein
MQKRDPIAAPCPRCRAPVDKPCQWPSSGGILVEQRGRYHAARKKAADLLETV